MKRIILAGLLLVGWLSGGCAPTRDFDARLDSIVRPRLFSIIGWEARAIPDEIRQSVSRRETKPDDEVGLVRDYFAAGKQKQALESAIARAMTGQDKNDVASLEAELKRLSEQQETSAGAVEKVLEKQITDTLTQQGIVNPLVDSKINFPPVNFILGQPPYLLVISPRAKIESIREITLQSDLTPAEIEDVETRADSLGISSLIVRLGGLGATYPAIVDHEGDLRATINAATEEWVHQYLAFKPLGFLYILDLTGLARNYDIATMNETIAGMVSKEIGTLVYEKYYSSYEESPAQTRPSASFDFNREMREIRKTVDVYLAEGQIEEAEAFMEQKRQHLISNGYYIRKLNQAYFAFHGTYADSLTSVSPIGLELKQLRERSASLKSFLNTAAAMTSRQELRDSINRNYSPGELHIDSGSDKLGVFVGR